MTISSEELTPFSGSQSSGSAGKRTEGMNLSFMMEYMVCLKHTRCLMKRLTAKICSRKSFNKMFLLYTTTLILLSLCACPVTSLRACGGELTNLLVEHCSAMKRTDQPVKRMDPSLLQKPVSSEENSIDATERFDILQKALVHKVQTLMNEWRERHSYDVNVGGFRIRRKRRAVTLSGFLDQCCSAGCRLSDLVSAGFC